MENKSNKILYNVAYNPETNPIEQVFSKVKTIVRRTNTTSITALIKAVDIGFKSITKEDLVNFFKHSFS